MIGDSFLILPATVSFISGWLLPGYGLAATATAAIIVMKSREQLKAAQQKKFLTEGEEYAEDNIIRLHIVSETEYITKGQGVHTAYIVHRELMSEVPGIVIKTNNEGGKCWE